MPAGAGAGALAGAAGMAPVTGGRPAPTAGASAAGVGGAGGVAGVAGQGAGPGAGTGGAGAGAGTGEPQAGQGGAAGSAGAVAGGEPIGRDPQAGGEPVEPEPTTGPFPPVTDFMAAGPYTTTTLVNVGPANNYTVYLPVEPPPEGAGNPLVAWTSGGGTTHVVYTLLPHLASHGFVVVTANTIPGIGAEAQLGEEMIAGIDWALAEHERAGGMLEGRLDTSKIAAAGYSMGSLATFTIASDPRLTTTVHVSGGNMAPERVQNLHAPAAFICGIPDPACSNLLSGTCDIAGANCATDFENATTPVFYARFESGHLGILTSPFMERINALTTAWLRHYLMGDTTLKDRFFGAGCEYCSDSNWMVQQKNF